jgi:hypothetical protein
MCKNLVILLCCWLAGHLAQAQVLKLEKEETFVADVVAVFGRTTSKTAPAVAAEFETTTWKALSEDQRKKTFQLARAMQAKGVAPVPHLEHLLACLNAATKAKKSVAPEQLTKLIEVSEQTFKEFGQDVLGRFLNTTETLLRKNLLYASSFNRLRVAQPVALTFDYVAKNKATEELPAGADSLGWSSDAKKDSTALAKTDPAKKEEPKKDAPKVDEWGWPIEEPEKDKKKADEKPADDWGSNDGWGDEASSDYKPAVADKPGAAGKKTIKRPEVFSQVFVKPEMPVFAGPVIQVPKTDLVIAGQHDSLKVAATEGKLYVSALEFVGKGGKVDWSSVGLPAGDPSVELDEYHFNIRKPELNAEYAKMSYKTRLDSTSLGVFEYKSVRAANKQLATYPRFQSYYNHNKVKNLAKDVEYTGGFSLVGRRFSSANFASGTSTIVVSKNGSKKFRASSRREFNFTDSTIRNPAVDIAIYINQGQDSISHPGSRLDYNIGKGLVNARKDRHEYNYTPYSDSYHKVEVSADNLKWNVAQDSMEFSILSSNASVQDSILNTVKAEVRSVDFFSDPAYRSLQGLGTFNPVGVAVSYGKANKTTEFASADLAKQYKLSPASVKGAMRYIDRLGYVHYDEATDWVKLKRKAILYFNSNNREIDFDNLEIYSATQFGRNITLDLNSYDLIVRGVRLFPLWRPASDQEQLGDDTPASKRLSEEEVARRARSKGVWAYPEKNTIRIGKNRSITFNGMVEQKGYGKFWGKDFAFRYDTFKINMPTIDSIGFIVRDSLTGRPLKRRNKKGEPTAEDSLMANKIKNVNGIYYLADPRNRSGEMRRFADQGSGYPRFAANAGAQITFSGGEILGGERAYADSAIRFDMYAFKLDSMQNTRPDANPLLGMFRTNGIFPNFEEQMKILPDNSFGFVHKTASNAKFPGGYPLYTDSVGTMKEHTGTFDGTITLNNEGIRGEGTVRYLTGTFQSNDLIYYPDSVTSLSKHISKKKDAIRNIGSIKPGDYKGASYPDVDMLNYQMRWFPRADSMLLGTTDTVNTPFRIYQTASGEIAADQKSTWKGTLVYTPDSLMGRGILENAGMVAKSPMFTLKQTKFNARNAEYLKIKTTTEQPALLATNVAINYDLGERFATIRTEVEGQKSFSFPYTQYKTSLGEARWNFDNKNIIMRLPEGGDIENSEFASTNPAQKGLSFKGASAIYDLNKYVLAIGGVPYIISVDAKIFPKNGDVTIRGEADIDPLKDSEMFLAADNEYHKLRQGNFKITSRDHYEGNAVRPYINDEGTEFPMKFDDFNFAMMDVIDNTEGKKSKEAVFKKERHTFSSMEISEEDNFIKQAGIQYKGKVTMRAIDPQLAFKGFYRYTDLEDGAWFEYNGKDSVTYVETIRQVDKDKYGTGIFVGKGRDLYTSYESQLQGKDDEPIFRAAGPFKKVPAGYSVAANDRRDKKTFRGNYFVYGHGSGIVQFEGALDLLKPDPKFNVRTSGVGRGNFKSNQYAVDMMLTVQLEEGKGDAFEQIAKHLEDQADFEESTPRNTDTLFAKLGALLEPKAIDDYVRKSADSEVRDVLGSLPLVISSAKMNWSEDGRAFYSTGKIQVSNIFKKAINMNMRGAIEIPMTKNAEESTINIFLQVNARHWYFITYRKGDVKILTSNSDVNAKIANPKSKDKFKLAESSEKNSFVARYNRDYANGKDALAEPSEEEEEETIEKDDGKH